MRPSIFRSARFLLFPLFAVPLVAGAVLLWPGVGSAGPKVISQTGKAVVCGGLSGNTATTVTVTSCQDGGRSATGGSGTLAFSSPTGGTVDIHWANSATMVISLTMKPYAVCNDSFAFKVKISGSITSQTYAPDDPGVGGRIKTTVCAVPTSNGGYTLSLEKGDFQF